MFASDWPVINLASDYQAWFEIVKTFIDSLSADEQEAICYSNASLFYGFSEDDT